MMTLEDMLLLNLSGFYEDMEDGEFEEHFTGQYTAYKMLTLGTGQDFGYDVEKWKAWLAANPNGLKPVPPSKVEIWLKNVEQSKALAEAQSFLIGRDIRTLPDYMPKEEALQNLRDFTGLDFGHDGEKWRDWFVENRPNELLYFPPGYQPLSNHTPN
ncbi:MAG: hypothetical protein V4671_15820 [Armatimonadota bacterium]